MSLADTIKSDIDDFISRFIDEITMETDISKNRLNELWLNISNNKNITNKQNPIIKKKKTVSAYVNFCNKQRPLLKEKYPKLSFGDISKQLGKLWSELSPEEQNKYKTISVKEEIIPPVLEKRDQDNFIFYDDDNDDDNSLETFILDDDDDFELDIEED